MFTDTEDALQIGKIKVTVVELAVAEITEIVDAISHPVTVLVTESSQTLARMGAPLGDINVNPHPA